MARIAPLASVAAGTWETVRPFVPNPAVRFLKRILKRGAPPLGRVNIGDLARTSPISWHYGYDRGTPIDRYYIEGFLERQRANIRGRVLEVGESVYSRQFGSGVTQQDVLHAHSENPEATIVGDLASKGVLPAASFDCMIVTQTLQLIYDVHEGVRQMRDALKPGGVLLLTVPGVTSVERGEWRDTWFWSLTKYSARRVFGDVFGPENVEITVYGNVYAASSFLYGLAVEEVKTGWLDHLDPAYPVTIGIRAKRAD